MEQMSITKALSELKLLDKKINDKIDESKFIGITYGNKIPIGYKSNDDFKKSCESQYTSVVDLIELRANIKAKVAVSNSYTAVRINGYDMSVIEAIAQKEAMEYRKRLLMQLRKQFGEVKRLEAQKESELEILLQKQLEVIFGKENKPKAEDIENVSKSFMATRNPNILDGINILEKIDALNSYINDFLCEVDFALSESNARTII